VQAPTVVADTNANALVVSAVVEDLKGIRELVEKFSTNRLMSRAPMNCG
jgi:type II secretory pathway component GspD/PulD (secretin)